MIVHFFSIYSLSQGNVLALPFCKSQGPYWPGLSTKQSALRCTAYFKILTLCLSLLSSVSISSGDWSKNSHRHCTGRTSRDSWLERTRSANHGRLSAALWNNQIKLHVFNFEQTRQHCYGNIISHLCFVSADKLETFLWEILPRTNLKILLMFGRILKHCLSMPNLEHNIFHAENMYGKWETYRKLVPKMFFWSVWKTFYFLGSKHFNEPGVE